MEDISLNDHLRSIAAKGGRAATGDRKRRSKAFYRRIQKLSIAARKKRKAA